MIFAVKCCLCVCFSKFVLIMIGYQICVCILLACTWSFAVQYYLCIPQILHACKATVFFFRFMDFYSHV